MVSDRYLPQTPLAGELGASEMDCSVYLLRFVLLFLFFTSGAIYTREKGLISQARLTSDLGALLGAEKHAPESG